jgi:hypothetical protein
MHFPQNKSKMHFPQNKSKMHFTQNKSKMHFTRKASSVEGSTMFAEPAEKENRVVTARYDNLTFQEVLALLMNGSTRDKKQHGSAAESSRQPPARSTNLVRLVFNEPPAPMPDCQEVKGEFAEEG